MLFCRTPFRVGSVPRSTFQRLSEGAEKKQTSQRSGGPISEPNFSYFLFLSPAFTGFTNLARVQ